MSEQMIEIAGGIIIAGAVLAVFYAGCKLFANGTGAVDGLAAIFMVLLSVASMGWIVFLQ
jgi:hypothetical protein